MLLVLLFLSQKALACKRALSVFTSLNAETKSKLEPLLRAEFMSPDESIVESFLINGAAEKALCPVSTRHKKLTRGHATWHREEFEEYNYTQPCS